MAHNRHDQAIGSLCGDANMHAPKAVKHTVLILITRIDIGKFGQNLHQGPHEEGQKRQFGLVRVQILVHILPQGFQFGDIAFLNIGKMRNAALGLLHFFSNFAAQAHDARVMNSGVSGKA